MSTNVERVQARNAANLKRAQERDEAAQQAALDTVLDCANARSSAEHNLQVAIKAARKAGCSLRAIAGAAGANHETIRRQAG